jgi:transcriptional regulator with XRE-family HTH domain
MQDTSVFSRLREERKRLGLDQKSVADLCGVAPKTVGRWESTIPIPADKLEMLFSCGVDALYVVAGKRTPVIADARVDKSLLAVVMAAIDEALSDNGLTMAPEKKAQLVVAIYDLYAETGKPVDKGTILRLVNVAA